MSIVTVQTAGTAQSKSHFSAILQDLQIVGRILMNKNEIVIFEMEDKSISLQVAVENQNAALSFGAGLIS